MKAMKLKALMDIDPLGHAVVPKFCPASSAPFYSMGSAGSSYSAASLSAGSSRSSAEHYSALHDPLARHPQSAGSRMSASFSMPHSAGTMPHSAGTMPHPGGFAHPKPIKVEPNPRRSSFEESNQAFKRTMAVEQQRMSEQEAARVQQKEEEEAARRGEEDVRREEEAARRGEEDDKTKEAMETESSPGVKQPVEPAYHEETSVLEENEEDKEEEKKSVISAAAAAEDEEPSPKRARNITYQCCLCEYNSSVLSSLTSHLEGSHSLIDYELIKMLLACLGDIGT